MRSFVRGALALASVAMVAPAIVHAQAKPVVAVLYFDNNSFGKDRADYDGLGKGIADMLITDMAANPNLRVVERERIQALLVEQSLTKQGSIDPQTAIRLGKIVGAQYMIVGGFLSDSKGKLVLTARTINVETSVIANPVRLDASGDDVLGLIGKLSTKLNTEMKLPSLRVGDAGAAGATPAGQPASPAAAPPTQVATATPTEAKEQKTEAKPAQKTEAKPVQAAQKSSRKMDMKTAMLYSKALEEEDAGNRTKAVELYRQVVSKFPEYAPAQQKIAKLSRT
ncbi:MAG TPA: CsgG/HfaB family protein [Gemmatimonadaceae bacterium]|jgi:TolB-like protein